MGGFYNPTSTTETSIIWFHILEDFCWKKNISIKSCHIYYEDNLCLDPIGSNLCNMDLTNFIKLGRNVYLCRKIHKQYLESKYNLGNLGVSPNFEITVACSLKFHWCLRTLSLRRLEPKLIFSCLCPVGCLSLAETANRADAETGKLQFWS